MEIPTIKEQLSMLQVLNHYNLQADKNNRLQCPFHDDKTPSLQVYLKTNTCFCFSSNCKTNGKPIDVIDFIEFKESEGGQPITKHQAIKKAKELVAETGGTITTPTSTQEPISKNKQPNTILQKLEKTFLASIYMSKTARNYCESRALNISKLIGFIGFNSAQFHHSGRFKKGEEALQEQLIKDCLAVGMLQILQRINNQTGEAVSYRTFAKNCIVFFLRDTQNKPVGLYGRSIASTSNKNKSSAGTSRHFYLTNRQGLYPNYPGVKTTHLILTESIIDCATLQQITLPKNYSLLALYGTNGLTKEHSQAISQLTNLKEIIFCFDNDEAGRKATAKYQEQLQELYPKLQFSTIELPNKDINETAQAHSDLSIFNQLITNRTLLNTTVATPQVSIKKQITNNQQLVTKNQLAYINSLIAKSGIVGEENSRLLLFIIASSYKTGKPLHAIVQGSSGSGKTHLISKIADMMPKEDVLRFTRITESSLYNWGLTELINKVLIFEDLDGIKEEALYPLRELISNQKLSSSVSVKDKKGNIKGVKKEVIGVFSSLSATTKGETYEDNMNRSFLLAVDESKLQTQKIIDYQNKKYAGLINSNTQIAAQQELQQIIRNLQNIPVINMYATKLQLPDTVHKKRRLNEMFQSIIKQITFINQKERPLKDGAIYTQLEDIALAIEVLFDSIVLKVDELDGSLRVFYERLKTYTKNKKTGNGSFKQLEIRQEFTISKSQLQRFINTLLDLEYLSKSGHPNKGFYYQIAHWDNHSKLKKTIKDHLETQLKQLEKT